MKNFFENFNVDTLKEFLSSHARKVWFVIVVAIVTAMAIISNHGYGHLFRSDDRVETHHYYHHSDESRRQPNRQPWKMQKPSLSGSSSKSSSSGHK